MTGADILFCSHPLAKLSPVHLIAALTVFLAVGGLGEQKTNMGNTESILRMELWADPSRCAKVREEL